MGRCQTPSASSPDSDHTHRFVCLKADQIPPTHLPCQSHASDVVIHFSQMEPQSQKCSQTCILKFRQKQRYTQTPDTILNTPTHTHAHTDNSAFPSLEPRVLKDILHLLHTTSSIMLPHTAHFLSCVHFLTAFILWNHHHCESEIKSRHLTLSLSSTQDFSVFWGLQS